MTAIIMMMIMMTIIVIITFYSAVPRGEKKNELTTLYSVTKINVKKLS